MLEIKPALKKAVDYPVSQSAVYRLLNRRGGRQDIILVDRARWHTTQRLNVPENIRLILKPAGSSEHNRAKHLWKALRESAFYNTSSP